MSADLSELAVRAVSGRGAAGHSEAWRLDGYVTGVGQYRVFTVRIWESTVILCLLAGLLRSDTRLVHDWPQGSAWS